MLYGKLNGHRSYHKRHSMEASLGVVVCDCRRDVDVVSIPTQGNKIL